jgi:hypothetical protein
MTPTIVPRGSTVLVHPNNLLVRVNRNTNPPTDRLFFFTRQNDFGSNQVYRTTFKNGPNITFFKEGLERNHFPDIRTDIERGFLNAISEAVCIRIVTEKEGEGNLVSVTICYTGKRGITFEERQEQASIYGEFVILAIFSARALFPRGIWNDL